MSLAATAATIGRRPPYRPQCSVGRLLDTLDDADRAWLVDALEIPSTWTVSDILAVLAAEGHTIRPDTIRRHRRRSPTDGCACP